MAKYDFSIRYYGNALEDGRIPIKDLAPSLLALSESFHEIQKISNPNEPELSLDIKATSEGSFIVDLLLSNGKDLLNQAISLLTNKENEAVLNLASYVSIFLAAIPLIKKLKSHKMTNQYENKDGHTTLTFDDNSSITVTNEVVESCKSITFRKSVRKFVQPLENEGIEGIDYYHSKEETYTILKEDYSLFEVPQTKNKELEPTISEVYLQIINVAFEHGKWKFSDGTNQFFASIEDEEFIAAVEKNQQQFGSTDTLRVILQNNQQLTSNGLKSEFVVTKVLEHLKGAQQIALDLE
ncbi:TPA: hypothetical protein ACHR38_002893 [Listeria monocytogenes]